MKLRITVNSIKTQKNLMLNNPSMQILANTNFNKNTEKSNVEQS